MRGLFRNYLFFGLFVVLGFCFAMQSPAAVIYTLTLHTNGSGAIVRNPSINAYPAGSVVTVTATPGSGWYFSKWTGDATGNANPLTVTMNGNKVITGTFQALPIFTLTTATNGGGSVSLNPPGGSYFSNAVVSATATAATGWVFLKWTGDASGSSNVVSVTMNANKSIIAVFTRSPAIDQSPQNVIAEVGDTVNFNVHAVGTPPLSYQWWFNNSTIAGATSTTLTLSNVQSNQEGTYSITVSNAYGGASNAATLTITNGCVGTNVVTVATEAALRNAMAIGGLVRCCFNGTITLSNTIIVTRNVTLDAHNRSVVISGNNSNRLFNVQSGVTFSATNLVFANGRHVGQIGGYPGRGGAIYSDGGTVQLVSCALLSNSVTGGQGATNGIGGLGQGGAIYNDGGSVSLNSCVLVGNSVTGGTGGTNTSSGNVAGDGQGGAIFVRGGSLVLETVNAMSNSAAGGVGPISLSPPFLLGTPGNGDGGVVYVTNESAFVLNCNFSSNFCTAPPGGAGAASGGALFVASGFVTLSNNTLIGNAALGSNSPVFTDAQLKGSAGYGGALTIGSGQANIVRCQLNSNVAAGGNGYRNGGSGEAQGGAIYSSGTVFASESSFTGNQALSGGYAFFNPDGRGGAIYNLGSAVLSACSFQSNIAKGGNSIGPLPHPVGHGQGGAICNVSQLNITNCTIALNSAIGGDASFPNGPPGAGIGGGIYNSNGVLTAVNVTIASNAVWPGQWYYTNGFSDGANVARTNGTLTLINSILAYPNTNHSAWGTITDAGHNMSSDGSANFNSGSSFNFTDPLLGPLADNGGPTLTMALSWNSPAVDFGTSVGAPLTDQRGFPRPVGSGFDMGALELNASPIQGPILTINRAGNNVRLNFGAQAGATYVLQGSTALTTWSDLEVIGPYGIDTQINRTNSLYFPAIEFFRLRVQ